MSEQEKNTKPKENFMQIFNRGARKGLQTSLNVILPSVVFAFFLTQLLNLSGIMSLLGKVFAPLMGIFGLPGEAAMPLTLSFIAFGGAISSTASLVELGILNGTHALIMLPFIFLTGSIPMWTGRILEVTGLDQKYYKVVYAVALLGAILSMFIMRLILSF